ncbi:MAG: hypothetical protein KAX38_09810, partial [Candidatus Krumholzibacteria bacterium]|nr:hypothetical protein [Candidatus Krumholzibacteria bacterium]
MSMIGAAFHLVFALLLVTILGGFLIYVTFIKTGKKWRRRFWLSIPFQVLGLAVPLVVRARFTFEKFNLVHIHRQGMLILSDHLAVVDPLEIVSRMGIAFYFAVILSCFIFLVAPRRNPRNLVVTLFLFPVILVLNPLTASLLERQMGYLHYRLIYAAPASCLLALGVIGLFRILIFGRADSPQRKVFSRERSPVSRMLGHAESDSYRRSVGPTWYGRMASLCSGLARRLAAAAVIAIFLFYPVRYGMIMLKGSVDGILNGKGGIDERHRAFLEELNRKVPDHSVIVSDPRTSYLLSAYSDHFVVVTFDQHCSPTDLIALERIEAVRDILSPAFPFDRS